MTQQTNPVEGGNTSPLSTMRVARMHKVGEPLTIDRIPIPSPRATDVVIRVKACGVVPNLVNVLTRLQQRAPHLCLPQLPAIFGLDAAGTIVEMGSQVHGVSVGDRVYVNPARSCGACRPCILGNSTACRSYTFNGYFGFGSGSRKLYEDYPYGGLAEYMTAPQSSLIRLGENLSFEAGARWGYLGTGYAALRRGGADMSTTVLVNGISGTLGLGVALFALALGVPKILGVGRDRRLLERVRDIAPDRIFIHSSETGESVGDWARALTGGEGTNLVIDALPSGAAPDSFRAAFDALARGGRHVNIGGVREVPLNVYRMMSDAQSMIGSLWFTTAQGQEMADLAGTNSVRLDVFENEIYPLEEVNKALSGFENRQGGFSNYVIRP